MWLFNLYSWVTGIGWMLLDLLPQMVRGVIFKTVLENFRSGATIDYKTYIRYPSKVSIGVGTMINRGCRFYASHHYPDVRIRIGNHVAVAPEVSFFAAGHDYTNLSLPDIASSITVGDYVWIGGAEHHFRRSNDWRGSRDCSRIGRDQGYPALYCRSGCPGPCY